MKNIVDRFGHLSASHIAAFITDPPRWALERVFQAKTPVGPEAHRGTAVEHGAVATVTTGKLGKAIEAALAEYDEMTTDWDVDEAQSVREPIPAMIEAMAQAIDGLTKTHGAIESVQRRVEFELFGVPWLGFTDIEFERLTIDLKTAGRTPNKLSKSHAIQGTLYRKSREKPTAFVYAVGLKSGVNVKSIDLDDDSYSATLPIIEDAVRRMDLVLSLGDDVIKSVYRPSGDEFWLAGEKAANKLARAAVEEVWR